MHKPYKLAGLAFLFLSVFLLFTCSLYRPDISLVIYNDSPVQSGTLTITYGDNKAYYWDGQITLNSPDFPCHVTLGQTTNSDQYLIIAEFEGASGLAYDLILTDTSLGKLPEAVMDLNLWKIAGIDTYEPDNTIDLAQPIQWNELQARSIYPSTDFDYLCFYAEAGQSYVIETIKPDSSSPRTDITLYDAAGTQIAYNSTYTSDYSAHLEWTAPSTGPFYIEPGCYTAGNTGSYLVFLGRVSGAGSGAAMATVRSWNCLPSME